MSAKLIKSTLIKIRKYKLPFLLFKDKRPMKSLIQLIRAKKTASEKACFLYYQLGMYYTVVQHSYNGRGWKASYAKAVSYAAIGEYQKALDLVDLLRYKLNVSRVIMRKLSFDIAPYLPTVSLQIVDEMGGDKIFKLALLVHLGKLSKAQELADLLDKEKPLVNLYSMNLVKSADEKLSLLNKVLTSYQLESVKLKNSLNPLSAHNLYSKNSGEKKTGPLVSILVTTYNSEEYIHTVIESLLNQTYRDIEILVVDDASTDNTKKILQKYTKLDNRIKCLFLNTNVGTFVAKTEGLKLSTGEFITCHDSDDWAHPRKIELQVAPLLKDKKLIFTTSQWIRIRNDGCLYIRKVYPALRLNPASPLFRKDIVLKETGAWDQVRTGADSEFLERLKIVFGERSMEQVKKPLTIGAHRNGSLMTDFLTGYTSEIGVEKRLEYWESWMRKHLKIAEKMYFN